MKRVELLIVRGSRIMKGQSRYLRRNAGSRSSVSSLTTLSYTPNILFILARKASNSSSVSEINDLYHVVAISSSISPPGVLKNGESRLLFSSKQVEYARYWIYAMGLTKDPLPLPCSDVLVLPDELKNLSRISYKTGSDLRGALKVGLIYSSLSYACGSFMSDHSNSRRSTRRLARVA